jgi:hypothetical protein
MAIETSWDKVAFAWYNNDNDVSCPGANIYRGQAFPPEIHAWLTDEISFSRVETVFYKRIMSWFASYGRSVKPDTHGCIVDGLVAELQRQESPILKPQLIPPRGRRPDFFVVARKDLEECFIIRSDAKFIKGRLFWTFDESEAKRKSIPR